MIYREPMTDTQQVIAGVPLLEERCPSCNGRGHYTGDGEATCLKCGGAGYLPTEDGKRVLALMQHNLPAMLRNASE